MVMAARWFLVCNRDQIYFGQVILVAGAREME